MVQRLVDQSKSVEEMLETCQSSWVGCNWDANIGGRTVDLSGLHSRQAWLAAKATRGSESEYWRNVFDYLDRVEKDARRAAEIARESVAIWSRGDVSEALARLDQAIALESAYRSPSVYSELRRLMRAAPPSPAV